MILFISLSLYIKYQGDKKMSFHTLSRAAVKQVLKRNKNYFSKATAAIVERWYKLEGSYFRKKP